MFLSNQNFKNFKNSIKFVVLSAVKGKIKTNISGTLDYFGGSWLRITEAGDNLRYGKTYIVPVRDGKFSYDIYTDYPRLFHVMIGKEYRSSSVVIANFWSIYLYWL